MLATANRILRDNAEANDACVLAFRKLDTYSEKGEIQGWLRRIVINAALTRLRRHRQLREGQIDELMPEYDRFGVLLGPPDSGTTTPEDLVVRNEQRESLEWVSGQ